MSAAIVIDRKTITHHLAIAASECVVGNPAITPFWDYFRVGGHSTGTLEFACRALDSRHGRWLDTTGARSD